MTSNLESVVADLASEIAQLASSRENWQIVLHGGRRGDVVMEVKRTRQLAPPRKQQGKAGNDER